MHHGAMRRRAWTAALVAIVMVVMTVAPAAQAAPRPSAGVDRSGANALSREPLADLAAGLDYDLTRIFRHVADEIRYEPYPGILRGARGTLAAHAGNSADQALLLGALLDESLIPYRFAQGTIDAETAAALLASTAMTVAGTRELSEAVLIEDARAARDDVLVPGPEDEAQGAAVAAGVADVVATAQRQLLEGVATIEAALHEAAIDLPDAEMQLPLLERTAHTWVQASQGAAWVDLDPSLTAAQAGETLAEPATTSAVLADDLRHRIDFVALVERVRGGALVTEPMLEYGAFADELAGIPVTFGHIKPSGLDRLGISIRGLTGGDAGLAYSPVLDVEGRAIVADQAVSFGSAETGSSLSEDLVGDTGLAASSGSPALGAAEGEATAEWLEVRITAPGREPSVARRTVFDRVDPEARRSGTLTPQAVTALELVDLDGAAGPRLRAAAAPRVVRHRHCCHEWHDDRGSLG